MSGTIQIPFYVDQASKVFDKTENLQFNATYFWNYLQELEG